MPCLVPLLCAAKKQADVSTLPDLPSPAIFGLQHILSGPYSCNLYLYANPDFPWPILATFVYCMAFINSRTL